MVACDFVLIDERQMLRNWFPLLDEGVEAIEARNEGREAIAADVFASVLSGEVEMRLVRADEVVIGFLITYRNEMIAGAADLYVWQLYLRPGSPDVMADIVAELDLMAGEQRCGGVLFGTTRMAWQRRLSPHGYRLHQVVFRKELSP